VILWLPNVVHLPVVMYGTNVCVSDPIFKTLGSGSDLSQAPEFGSGLSHHITEPMIRRNKKLIVTYGNGLVF
jgi:hypothetical protein